MKRAVLTILLAAGATSAVSAQTSTESAATAMPAAASAALRRAAALYTDGAAHASSFTQIYTPAGFATARRESGTVWIQAPQRLRFEYAAPEKSVYTYDAGEGRFFSPEDKQLTVRRLSADEKARLPIVFLSDQAELALEYAISVEAGEEGATRLLLKPTAKRSDLAWLRLSIARSGEVQELSFEDSGGNRTEFRFEAWRVEKARPASDFRIAGPPGTRILEN